MTLPVDQRHLRHGEDDRGGLTAPATSSPAAGGTAGQGPRAAVPETADGNTVQLLELRGTIIRLREQLDLIHMRYEERVQQLESIHRAQRADLEDTIRHLRDRLQAADGNRHRE